MLKQNYASDVVGNLSVLSLSLAGRDLGGKAERLTTSLFPPCEPWGVLSGAPHGRGKGNDSKCDD